MNTMKKTLVMVFSLFLFGANAYAAQSVPGLSHASNSSSIQMPIANTKEKAYSLGFQKLQNLKMQSGKALSDELRLTLSLSNQREDESVTIGEANVTVQELMNEQGKIVYRGIVNVVYHFSVQLDSH